ncbi:MAG: phospho-N-acetylmuramoyl-pentapeptide-transferase [Chloroherpetonaceae bacterium]|nr:phospho-N-acetylmuramoyl-pentapeptide-transferase [Chthonomonadaceae bacterium]MDW8208439.1 phospho-N-acetylmuramoyl-pentapeptide-transferase [Chloroherpetonaceae bacterium]
MRDAVFAFVLAFGVAALSGRWAIPRLRTLGVRQNVSEDAPATHRTKQGTPTMGGVLVLIALGSVWLLSETGLLGGAPAGGPVFGGVPRVHLRALMLLTLAFGMIGLADDYLSMRRGRNLGLRAREKLAAQFLIAAGFAWYLYATAQEGLTTFVELAPAQLATPFAVDLGIWYYPVAGVFLVALSNATNITDGLDGLSGGLTLLVCLALSALVSTLFPAYAVFTMGLAGGIAGFLWWNAHPAQVFMGDTGSLALGAALGGVALLGKQEVALIVASLVCWAELLSVVVQVLVFQYRRRTRGLEYARTHRFFRRAPLHHHFEEIGWAETQVVFRFYLLGAVCAGLALLWGRW